MYEGIRGARKQVEDLLKGADKIHRHHFVASLHQQYPDIKNYSTVWGIPGGGSAPFWRPAFIGLSQAWRDTRYFKRQFHAEIQYRYYYPGFSSVHAHLNGMLDVLGVNLNPQIIWNAIPWSFVIDWLLSVGQWYGQFRRPATNLKVVILQYLWSVDIDRISIVTRRANYNTTGFPGGNTSIAVSCREQSYARVATIPDVMASVRRRNLNSNEFILAGALAVTRRKRRK